MKIAIYGRYLKKSNLPFAQELFALLEERNIEYYIYEGYYKQLKDIFQLPINAKTFSSHADVRDDIDYMLSLGGDGTILDTINLIRNANIPIVGINFGRLGFLASISKEHILQLLNVLETGSYVVDKRAVLEVESNNEIFPKGPFALNEFSIQRRNASSMVSIKAFLNGEFLTNYWGDGVIVATPTGSTGHSLSCGGPIIHPNSDNLVITPMAPHNLNVRPLVVASDVIVSFEVFGREKKLVCTLDSKSENIDHSYLIAVKKADFTANMVRLDDLSFINALKEKLHWGIDQRN